MQPYQHDSYRKTFQSRVAEVRQDERGDWVHLEETYFYPTSGGQPHDTGVLEALVGEAQVTDVQKEGDAVWHRLEGDTFPVGDAVSGLLDWERRYRHMQRHTAQHLLSQVFVQLDPAFETRAVSLMGPVCTLDLAREPTPEDLLHAEALVNRIGYAALPITSFEIEEHDIGRYPLRRPPKVGGRIRLVQMGDFELSACGGTHLRSTAEALPIKLLGQTRVKGGLGRVRFMAGWEALDDYRAKHEALSTVALEFSALPEEVPARLEGLRQEHSTLKHQLRESRARLAQLLADRLLQAPPNQPVVHILHETDADLLGPLAQELVGHAGTVALLAARTGDRAQLLFTRHEDAAGDMRTALDAALSMLSGRGGGSTVRAQGSGSAEGLEDALAAAARVLEQA